jgi:hypothetical protein
MVVGTKPDPMRVDVLVRDFLMDTGRAQLSSSIRKPLILIGMQAMHKDSTDVEGLFIQTWRDRP